jgi:flagellar biosynthetic protein FliR
MLAELLVQNTYAVLVIFARVGAAMMVLPGFGEGFVFPRARLGLALLLGLALAPIAGPSIPPLPASEAEAVAIIASEVVVGLAMGALVRILASALQTAGQIVATQTGLASAALFDPTQGEQGVVIGRFLSIAGVVAIFASDLHFAMLRALADSYAVLTPGALPPIAAFGETALGWVADAFTLAAELAAPILAGSLVFFLGLGFLARLMPQIQVFFVVMPLQIALGLWLFLLALSSTMLWYLDFFAARVSELHAG